MLLSQYGGYDTLKLEDSKKKYYQAEQAFARGDEKEGLRLEEEALSDAQEGERVKQAKRQVCSFIQLSCALSL